ncbi:MAG: DUF362 domain-containing protein [Opitutales bacterium]|nr:DUF362 domain-containing protein [Opitutales bacterium]
MRSLPAIITIFFCAAAVFCADAFCALAGFEKSANTVFAAELKDSDNSGYGAAVEALFGAFEEVSGKKIEKGAKGKVGIKVYTNSGAGLATPPSLVRAVIKRLEKSGYKKGDVCIVDMSKRRLRECGFLPKYTEAKMGVSENFEGSPVIDIESGEYFSADWYYDNPLMPRDLNYSAESPSEKTELEGRKSYLPVPLFLTVDFWINLPVLTDLPGIGVCGALGNATIWNMSNNERFFQSPANAPIALAECAAIPELNSSMIFSVLALKRFQYVGANVFNARFCSGENLVLLSSDPVALDAVGLECLNAARVQNGFPTIESPAIFKYARQLGLGESDLQKVKFRKVLK